MNILKLLHVLPAAALEEILPECTDLEKLNADNLNDVGVKVRLQLVSLVRDAILFFTRDGRLAESLIYADNGSLTVHGCLKDCDERLTIYAVAFLPTEVRYRKKVRCFEVSIRPDPEEKVDQRRVLIASAGSGIKMAK